MSESHDDDDGQWWERVKDLGVVSEPKVTDDEVNEIWNRAEELWVAGETKAQSNGNGMSGSDQTFLKDVMRAGTMSDKVAALTLAAQQNLSLIHI